VTFRVRFAETDQMGVAHHAAYVVWLEAARVEWMRERGLSYRELEEQGISMAVSALSLRYRRAARFDDRIAIDARLVAIRSRYGRYRYRLVGEDGALLAEATTEHVATDRRGRAVRLPERWLAAFRAELQPDLADAP
jgi:acyl-CoA thioester hydrolase